MSTFLPLNSGTVYRINQRPDRSAPIRKHEVQALARKFRENGVYATAIGQPQEPEMVEKGKFLPLQSPSPAGLGLVTGKLAQERSMLEKMCFDTREMDQKLLNRPTLDLYV